MGYRHIPNLFSDQTILLFKRCYASEKVHGTSSNVSWREGKIRFSPGGCKMETFLTIFDQEALTAKFTELGHAEVVVFGEQYGGKQQGMSTVYGKDARFIAFEVKIGDTWLNVPNAADVATKLGLDFVPYHEISTDLAEVDAERDRDSEVAIHNGMGPGHKREGVVLRPLQEFRDNRGERVIAKHKRDDFRETRTPRKVGDAPQSTAGADAALEWVTDTRLEHVLDHLRADVPDFASDMSSVPQVISAMLADVEREGAGEVTMDKETRKAISAQTVKMLKQRLQKQMKQT
jgi:hypothetical protein